MADPRTYTLFPPEAFDKPDRVAPGVPPSAPDRVAPGVPPSAPDRVAPGVPPSAAARVAPGVPPSAPALPRKAADAKALLEGLNPEQAAAVSAADGPLLVLAGAGSGKTRVLTRRLAWLVAHGAPEASVVAMTFTNKAAGEMKERVGTLLGTHRPRSFVGTFHAYCVRLLRRFAEEAGVPRSFVVFDSDDQLAIVRRALKELALPDKVLTPKAAHSKISHAKNGGVPFDEYPKIYGDFLGTNLVTLHKAYEKALRAANGLDFDDLLVLSARLVRKNDAVRETLRREVRSMLVDEYQDTNRLQADIVKGISGPGGNVFAVGDEDQSIYRWRGADVGNILEFARDFPGAKTIRLERNYRSKSPILDAAGAVVAVNQRRLGKTLKAERGTGDKVKLLILDEERDEAREIVSRIALLRRGKPLAEVAVLFRTNAQSRPFEDELLRAKLPYILVGGTRFYERAEIKDALAYLRLSRNPADDVSFRRVVNVPARGVGAATLEALEAAAKERGTPLFDVLASAPDALTERARKALEEFRRVVAALGERSTQEGFGAAALVAAMLEETGLLALYEKSEDPTDEARAENLDALLAAAKEHERLAFEDESGEQDPGIAGFLDAVTLRADADDVDEKKGIVLMTVHAAKGLEFDEVFLAGVEDGNLPHASSRDDDDQLEEERRLAYVAMTRAKERLTLSYVRRRMVHGEWMNREESPFLSAIPARVLERHDLSSSRSQGFGGDFSGGRGALFPDYENESQESPWERSPSRPASPRPGSGSGSSARPAPGTGFRPGAAPAVRRPVPPPSPPRPAMRVTPPPPTASGFKRGSRVKHPEYGVGVILSIEGSGDAEKLTVYFDRAGRKKFVARFSNLSPA
ncbi:MAG: UvrD-helicase domain-containing protein [Acidobacteria bacterium]|nr:UvrD-helicase domain-containing protein [Acidobacteriota bacterium]